MGVAGFVRGLNNPSACKQSSDFILSTPSKRPVDLHNLASRTVAPRLQRCAVCDKAKAEHEDGVGQDFAALPQWRGWYACRRGLGKLATTVGSAMAAKGLLRHTSTTLQHYVKTVPSEAIRAVDKIGSLFHNQERPN